MFRGTFPHTIDAKGRVSFPARLRDQVEDKEPRIVIVTPSPFRSEPCLHVYSLPGWELVEQQISALPSTDPIVTQFRRRYVAAAMECELDKVGRILIMQHLREYAGLEKDVIWAGMGKLLELWSRSAWERQMLGSEQQEAAFEAAVREMKII